MRYRGESGGSRWVVVEFDACTRWMVDARQGFWQWLGCLLDGGCVFAAAQLLLELWGGRVELGGRRGVLLALRCAVLLAVALRQWRPCG